nr:MoxR family ATPase [uncultured Mogibacterium sp.]
MNIQEAKNQVKYAVISYLSKDEFGEYKIQVERQRPIFLVGPPGVGKTEIMSQVAEEMDIALVSYSMTHHTRQSAIGLPFISEHQYCGESYRTTEYTMSEIIASVYDKMEETGKREGMLFLDEINCVSETLAPAMLQFLQMKIFGRHRLPEGWVVITAGNPLEYNNSAREFDLATLDRLKRIDVEPELGPWLVYARSNAVHAAVLNYLSIKKDDFYSVRLTVDGKLFVTARGWVDLSEMIYLYEQNDIEVNLELVSQYIQDERIARDFTSYYDLFYRYRREYDIAGILAGTVGEQAIEKLLNAPFDERITVVRLINDALSSEFRREFVKSKVIDEVMNRIKLQKDEFLGAKLDKAAHILKSISSDMEDDLRERKKAHSISRMNERVVRKSIQTIRDIMHNVMGGIGEPSSIITGEMSKLNDERNNLIKSIQHQLKNSFSFIEKSFEGDNEMMIFVRTLSEDKYSAGFLANHGSEEYSRWSKGLIMSDREQELTTEIEELKQ